VSTDSARRVPAPVKRLVHLGSRTYGRLTAEHRMLPSFLICGGQRCGTTSLYRALSRHPAILKAVLHKGVHYFDIGYHRGPNWYRGHFPLHRQADRIADRLGVAPLAFESSPYYMYHPHAVARIAADLPGVKLVVLVRDPVERAHSQYAHEVARGFESEPTFAAALALETDRLGAAHERMWADPYHHSFSHQHHAYTERGRYVVHLERLAAHIGRDRIHVVDSGRFFTAPEAEYDAVLDFLGLPRLGYPPFERHNARPRSPLDPVLRKRLTAHFDPYDERLARWLGRDPSWR
jgi:Sulfotransferase domain